MARIIPSAEVLDARTPCGNNQFTASSTRMEHRCAAVGDFERGRRALRQTAVAHSRGRCLWDRLLPERCGWNYLTGE